MISVIMLTYNREQLVSRAIESIVNQTFRDFEFLIVDNGSTDKSGQIADEYARQDQRIKVIHRERGNIGAGRNTGLNAARGDYIAFIDDDDWVEPDFLEFLYNLSVENNAEVAICGASDKEFNEKIIMTAEEALIELMWRKRYNAGFPTKLFGRKLVQDLRFSESEQFDDIGLMYKLMANANTVAYHGLMKYHVFRHDQNHSNWTIDHSLMTGEILDEYLDCYRVRTKWLSKKFPNSAQAFRYFEWSFMISMVEKIYQFNLTNCEPQLEDMTKELKKHRAEFLGAPEILDFEKVWMDQYLGEGEK